MSGSFYGQLYGTIGMEIEGISHTKEYIAQSVLYPLQRNLGPLGKSITITRDASTEFFGEPVSTPHGQAVFSYQTLEAQKMRNFNQGSASVMGYEIITQPLPVEDLERVSYPLISALDMVGDFNSYRAAIHFHIGFGNNLRLLKGVLKLALNLDAVLFRLAGMGGTFRGKINKAAYARPLLNSTVCRIDGRAYGRVSNLDGKFAQVINPINALNAQNLAEFWASFGVKYEFGGGSAKYHPSRYQGVNFYSIPQHGTIEWRHLNKSGDNYALMAIAKFLRGAVEMSTLLYKHEMASLEIVPSNEEISVGDASYIISNIYAMCQNKEIEDLPTENEVAKILEILEISHFQPIPEKPVKTHLREVFLDPELVELGKLKLVRDSYDSCHVDIHNIKTISIFDDSLEGSITTKPSSLNFEGEDFPEPSIDEDEDEVW